MQILTNLFSTDYGILSVIVIAAVIYMSIFYWRFIKRHIEEDAKRAGK